MNIRDRARAHLNWLGEKLDEAQAALVGLESKVSGRTPTLVNIATRPDFAPSAFGLVPVLVGVSKPGLGRSKKISINHAGPI